MRRIALDVSNDIDRKIDQTIVRDEFATRSEFLRFIIITYLKKYETVSDAAESAKKEGSKLYYEHPAEDFEYGIPKDVIEQIWGNVKAKRSGGENTLQTQS